MQKNHFFIVLREYFIHSYDTMVEKQLQGWDYDMYVPSKKNKQEQAPNNDEKLSKKDVKEVFSQKNYIDTLNKQIDQLKKDNQKIDTLMIDHFKGLIDKKERSRFENELAKLNDKEDKEVKTLLTNTLKQAKKEIEAITKAWGTNEIFNKSQQELDSAFFKDGLKAFEKQGGVVGFQYYLKGVDATKTPGKFAEISQKLLLESDKVVANSCLTKVCERILQINDLALLKSYSSLAAKNLNLFALSFTDQTRAVQAFTKAIEAKGEKIDPELIKEHQKLAEHYKNKPNELLMLLAPKAPVVGRAIMLENMIPKELAGKPFAEYNKDDRKKLGPMGWIVQLAHWVLGIGYKDKGGLDIFQEKAFAFTKEQQQAYSSIVDSYKKESVNKKVDEKDDLNQKLQWLLGYLDKTDDKGKVTKVSWEVHTKSCETALQKGIDHFDEELLKNIIVQTFDKKEDQNKFFDEKGKLKRKEVSEQSVAIIEALMKHEPMRKELSTKQQAAYGMKIRSGEDLVKAMSAYYIKGSSIGYFRGIYSPDVVKQAVNATQPQEKMTAFELKNNVYTLRLNEAFHGKDITITKGATDRKVQLPGNPNPFSINRDEKNPRTRVGTVENGEYKLIHIKANKQKDGTISFEGLYDSKVSTAAKNMREFLNTFSSQDMLQFMPSLPGVSSQRPAWEQQLSTTLIANPLLYDAITKSSPAQKTLREYLFGNVIHSLEKAPALKKVSFSDQGIAQMEVNGKLMVASLNDLESMKKWAMPILLSEATKAPVTQKAPELTDQTSNGDDDLDE